MSATAASPSPSPNAVSPSHPTSHRRSSQRSRRSEELLPPSMPPSLFRRPAAEFALFGERGARALSPFARPLADPSRHARQYGVGAPEIGRVTRGQLQLRIESKGPGSDPADSPVAPRHLERRNRSSCSRRTGNRNKHEHFRTTITSTITAVSAASSAIPKPPSSPISACTPCSIAVRNPPASSPPMAPISTRKGHGLVQEIFQPAVLARLPGTPPWDTRATPPPAILADQCAAHRHRLQ